MDYQSIVSQLTRLRHERGISQQQLAEQVEVSRATINALENGRAHGVGLCKILKMLDYFGYEVNLKRKTPPPTSDDLSGS